MALKRFQGAPFGTQTSRFDVRGVHPDNKLPGTYTQIPYCKIANSYVNRRRGPGSHDITVAVGDFGDHAVEEKSKGPNWQQALNVAKFNAIPHMYYRAQHEHNLFLRDSMGPGRYESKDFIAILNDRPTSKRGICETLEQRFKKGNKYESPIPGPGTYGDPWTPLDKKASQSFCLTGLLSSGKGHTDDVTLPGSNLAPGRYEQKNSTQELLDKTVSARGPYDLYTGERYVVPRLVLESVHLGPGKYEFKSFTENLNDEHSKKKGHLSRYPQYPELPTERIFCSTLSQWPRDKSAPGPTNYEVAGWKSLSTRSAPSMGRHPPFNSSSKRFSQRLYRTRNPVGVGQYDVTRWQRYQHTNGSVGVFVSKAPRLPPRHDDSREQLLNERVHPKSISLDAKLELDNEVALI